MFSNEQWLANSGADFYNGVATQSLRFDDGSSAYLTRTPSSAGNRLKWTWSGWFKRTTNASASIFMAGTNGSNDGQIYFTTNTLRILNRTSGSVNTIKDNSALYRDSSAWYHVVVIWDTAQSDADDRVREYVNGKRITAFGSNTKPSQNTTSIFNNNVAHRIGVVTNGTQFFDGYMAEVNFLDGYTVSETDGYLDELGEVKNGVWIAKEYTGSYGTNGFRLKFDQVGVGTASTSTIGADTSGNTNHFTSSGIVASDCAMPDSPENNFATWNVVDAKGSAATMAEGNLKVTSSGSYANIPSTFMMSSGKWYWEVTGNTYSAAICGVDGIGWGASVSGAGSNAIGYWTTGPLYYDGGNVQGGASYATSDVLAVSVDMDSGIAKFYKNNVQQYSVTFGESGIPDLSAGAFPIRNGSTTGSYTIANFGQDSSFAGTETAQGNTDANGIGDFYYAPPTGFLSLCTKNLPEPTIGANSSSQADDHFNTVLHTGNGSAGSFTGVGFQPDFVWAKSRSNAYAHELWDSTRGVNSTLQSNSTGAEVTTTNRLVSFDTDGFSYGTQSNLYVNATTSVAWNWLANGGTTVTNESGSIDSTVQANTTAGFSIVTFAVPSSGTFTIGHGLNVKPDMVITKGRGQADNWVVYHKAISSSNENNYLQLNTTNATGTSTDIWGTAQPTTSVVGMKAGATLIASQNAIAYCFAEIEGYSKFGSFTGNGNVDGPFIYTGFRPAWIMVKSTTNTNSETNWVIWDNKRNGYNTAGNIQVFANQSYAEGQRDDNGGAGISDLDILSNGFKHRDATFGQNGVNGATFIYMAFAETPFKYANAR